MAYTICWKWSWYTPSAGNGHGHTPSAGNGHGIHHLLEMVMAYMYTLVTSLLA